MRKTLLIATLSASLLSSVATSANGSCPPVSSMQKAFYEFYQQGGDYFWRFDSFPSGAVVFVNKGKTKEEAAEAVKVALQNLHPKTVKVLGSYCIYQGSLSEAEFWAASYPTVVYDTQG